MPSRWDECEHAGGWVSTLTVSEADPGQNSATFVHFLANTKSPQCPDRSSIMKFVTRSNIFYRKKTISQRESSALRRKSSMSTSYASFQRFQEVSCAGFLEKWTNSNFPFVLDVRGMAQEVSVNVKKGVETKSYEGVSWRRRQSCNDDMKTYQFLLILLIFFTRELFSCDFCTRIENRCYH